MAIASLNKVVPEQHPVVQRDRAISETALHYVEGALEAHKNSFSDDEEQNRKLQWAVTASLERALQLLDSVVYKGV